MFCKKGGERDRDRIIVPDFGRSCLDRCVRGKDMELVAYSRIGGLNLVSGRSVFAGSAGCDDFCISIISNGDDGRW